MNATVVLDRPPAPTVVAVPAPPPTSGTATTHTGRAYAAILVGGAIVIVLVTSLVDQPAA